MCAATAAASPADAPSSIRSQAAASESQCHDVPYTPQAKPSVLLALLHQLGSADHVLQVQLCDALHATRFLI